MNYQQTDREIENPVLLKLARLDEINIRDHIICQTKNEDGLASTSNGRTKLMEAARIHCMGSHFNQ